MAALRRQYRVDDVRRRQRISKPTSSARIAIWITCFRLSCALSFWWVCGSATSSPKVCIPISTRMILLSRYVAALAVTGPGLVLRGTADLDHRLHLTRFLHSWVPRFLFSYFAGWLCHYEALDRLS